MDTDDIAKIRLYNQQITHKKFKTAGKLVEWMGAMQAQELDMAKWAIGMRLPGVTEEDIDHAINRAEIIRTHLLRPTWHFVAAKYLHALLELSAPRIKSSLISRHKQLGLTNDLLKKSNNIIETTLLGHDQVDRNEFVQRFKKANIPLDNNMAAHLLLMAELDGLICGGRIVNKRHTYALLEERVPKPASIDKQEVMALLARKYFTSHGPATLEDFTWWSGLKAKDAREAIAMIKKEMVCFELEHGKYWMTEKNYPNTSNGDVYHIFPAYDEFLISYKNRNASITLENSKKAISNNGIFRPIITKNGQVIGIWKKQRKNKMVKFETDYFIVPQPDTTANVEKQFSEYLRFINNVTT